MGLILLAFGGFFALFFLLNAILQTMRGNARLGFIGTLLAFLGLITIQAALIVTNLDENPQFITPGVIVIAAFSMVISFFILIAEIRRPERNLVHSRGILGIGIGILLLVSTFTVPFMSAYFAVPDDPLAARAVTATQATSETNTTESAIQQQFTRFFRNIFQIVSTTTGLSNQEMLDQLNSSSTSVAQLVEDNGGDLDSVVTQVVDLTRGQIETLMANEQFPRLQGALLLSQLKFFIRQAINNPVDPNRLDDLATILLSTATPTESITSTPATVPSPTRTPTPTRTPRPASPTPIATSTRARFATRTPTPTPTLSTPCLAQVDYNLNLRAEPNFESAVLLVIPFDSTITLFGRSADSTWWLTEYENQAGWVSGEFIRLSDSCAELPVR